METEMICEQELFALVFLKFQTKFCWLQKWETQILQEDWLIDSHTIKKVKPDLIIDHLKSPLFEY